MKEIKSSPQTKNVPVIFLTARAGEESKIEGFGTGADDYLVRPFSSKELIARVQCHIDLEKKRSKALHDMYRLFDEIPFAVAALTGKDLVIEYINKYNLGGMAAKERRSDW